MVQIEPFEIIKDGVVEYATMLNIFCKYDNLSTSATFYWELNKVEGYADNGDVFPYTLEYGNISMDGEDYINWNNSTDINFAAYQWIADKLGVTIIS
jgi:hypothetical protein